MPAVALAGLLWIWGIPGVLDAPVAGIESGPWWPDSLGEIPTDGKPVHAIQTPPWGMVGIVLQVAVVLACPAMCVMLWVLQRQEQRQSGAREEGSVE